MLLFTPKENPENKHEATAKQNEDKNILKNKTLNIAR
jgi:hypothetical protein